MCELLHSSLREAASRGVLCSFDGRTVGGIGSSIFPCKDPVDVIATLAGGVGRRTRLGSVVQPDSG
jgi:hypothetical protein